MKRISKTLITLIILSCLFVSCHKYPKDPFISLRRPVKRLESGSGTTWRFTSYQISGVEHSHDFDPILTPNTLTDYALILSDNEDDELYTISPVSVSGNRLVEGSYGISGDNKTLSIQAELAGVTTSAAKFFVEVFKPTQLDSTHWTFINWTIVELYGKNLHITNNGIDIYFKKD